MGTRTKISLSFALLLHGSFAFGQMGQYGACRELVGVKELWHKLVLPDDLFEKVSPDLADLRIYGLTAGGDTLEAPYVLQPAIEETVEKDVPFQTINPSKNEQGYFFTWELPAQSAINEIDLDFEQHNFDWRANLEGSQDQREWFTIVEGYRILSIRQEQTDFHFSKLVFPSSKYRFFRLRIDSPIRPVLNAAKISLKETRPGRFNTYKAHSTKLGEDRKLGRSILDIDLENPVPVCRLKIGVKDQLDYFRPVTIAYATDSVKTDKGWDYNYRTLATGTLNSFEENEFRFESTILSKLRIVVENQDNQPLQLDSVEARGYVYELWARFSAPAAYYLCYGNPKAAKPQYDIDRFSDKIPQPLPAVELGVEQSIDQKAEQEQIPLFLQKSWLWVIMVLIILVLGLFSFRMMRTK